MPDHPLRHALNCVIAVHECDGQGYGEMAVSPQGLQAAGSILGWLAGFASNLAITLPWLIWQFVSYIPRMPFDVSDRLAGKRVLVTGVGQGLGRDLMLHCLEYGAEVIGIVRNLESRDALTSEIPANAPVTLLVADLSQPGALVAALEGACVPSESLNLAILCAAVKHDGQSVMSPPTVEDTFQVNFFSAVEFASWLCRSSSTAVAQPRTSATALVLVSSMGRWHGMHSSAGYNASKAALSIWGESLEMELRKQGTSRITITIVEPGLFASRMTRPTPLTRLLLSSRRQVASRIVSGALAGRKVIRPPLAFALLTWAACLLGRDFRYRLLTRAKRGADH
jgi:NAD(P)-dependent dehydrogenase (short-subunit alcohol dehydrogenase family)